MTVESPAMSPVQAALSVAPLSPEPQGRRSVAARVRPGSLARAVVFAVTVLLPTLLGGLYAFVIAADVYVSETQFWVRGNRQAQPSVLGGLLGAAGVSTSAEEALAVQAYVRSHDAVRDLDTRVGLREIYTRPEADWWGRLAEEASLERLVEFHRRMVEVRHDERSGITSLRVHAFRADDARRIAEALLELSEDLVNRLSQRSMEDTLRLARSELAMAEQRAREAREALDRFREATRELDPAQAGATVRGIVAALEGQLAQLRAEIGQKSTFMRPDTPALAALRSRAEAIEQEVVRERARLAGESGAIAGMIGGFERLTLQRDFADRGLASAFASLEQARVEAQRQQLYVVRVVQPRSPEEALYPRRWLVLASVAAAALLAYGIGLLSIAAVRDHVR
jgi:capsular polysaccharide transport system permease protein